MKIIKTHHTPPGTTNWLKRHTWSKDLHNRGRFRVAHVPRPTGMSEGIPQLGRSPQLFAQAGRAVNGMDTKSSFSVDRSLLDGRKLPHTTAQGSRVAGRSGAL
jgi:hypothetical protein